jgi:diguanylate cyclase (GGDEF)-like protein
MHFESWMTNPGSRPAWLHLAVWTGILLIGWFDEVTGNEIRVFPLYFLPLVLSAWFLGRSWALVHAAACTLAWLLAQLLAGREYSAGYIWMLNGVTQSVAFLTVAGLVSGLRQALWREQRAANTDALTGLANSRAFYREARRILADAPEGSAAQALVFVDLDHFKQVNDTLGHERGDAVLVAAARRLKAATEAGELAARLGGDEFALLLSLRNPAEAHIRLAALVEAIHEEPALVRSGVTASIGAVVRAGGAVDLDQLVASADAAMYEVKAAGRDGWRIREPAGQLVAPTPH